MSAIEFPLKRIESISGLPAILDAKQSIETSYTLTNSLAGDASLGTIAICTLNDGNNKSLTIANLADLRKHTYIIRNSHATTITIALPTAANNSYFVNQFTLAQNLLCHVEVQRFGSIYEFSVVKKVVTT